MVIQDSDNFNCIRKHQLAKKAEIHMTREKDVSRYSKFRSDLKKNADERNKKEMDKRKKIQEEQHKKMQEEAQEKALEFQDKKRKQFMKDNSLG